MGKTSNKPMVEPSKFNDGSKSRSLRIGQLKKNFAARGGKANTYGK